jgi:hypothetical protein
MGGGGVDRNMQNLVALPTPAPVKCFCLNVIQCVSRNEGRRLPPALHALVQNTASSQTHLEDANQITGRNAFYHPRFPEIETLQEEWKWHCAGSTACSKNRQNRNALRLLPRGSITVFMATKAAGQASKSSACLCSPDLRERHALATPPPEHARSTYIHAWTQVMHCVRVCRDPDTMFPSIGPQEGSRLTLLPIHVCAPGVPQNDPPTLPRRMGLRTDIGDRSYCQRLWFAQPGWSAALRARPAEQPSHLPFQSLQGQERWGEGMHSHVVGIV